MLHGVCFLGGVPSGVPSGMLLECAEFAGWSYNWVMILGMALCVRKRNKNCPVVYRLAGKSVDGSILYCMSPSMGGVI